jgi:hypothetical protein
MDRLLGTTPERARKINKIVVFVVLLALLIGMMFLSWIESPAPAPVIIGRSIPVMLIFFIMILITAASAGKGIRIGTGAFMLVSSPLMLLVFSMPFWGVSYAFIGVIIIVDLIVSVAGCKSLMEMNANETFLSIFMVFSAACTGGFLFELSNETILEIWDIIDMNVYYPMIEVLGVNLMVVFTWGIIGLFLLELSMMVLVLLRTWLHGKEKACSFR